MSRDLFGIIAAAMVIGALGVVTTKNVVHAALYLVVVLAGGAAQFILLGRSSSPGCRCSSTSAR